jgi:transposase
MVVAGAEAAPTMDAAPTSGRMVIVVGNDRRVIVDTSVDAVALARVLQVLEGR